LELLACFIDSHRRRSCSFHPARRRSLSPLDVLLVGAAHLAELTQLEARRSALHAPAGPVVAAVALGALHRDVLASSAFLLRHRRPPRACGARPSYSTTSTTTPAPTVRPPSRMANFSSFSMAMGVISSTSISALSPGMHMSMPKSLAVPVTSVVRK